MPAIRNGVWYVGVTAFLIGLTDRAIATLADATISAIDLIQLFTAALVFVGWLFFSPHSQGRDRP